MQSTKVLRRCSIIGCHNRRKPGVGLHLFPKSDPIRKLWLKAIGRENWQPGSRSYVCSEHFSESDLERTYVSGPRLRDKAVPSVFPAQPDRPERFRFKFGRIKSNSSKDCRSDIDPVGVKQCSVVLQRLPLEGDDLKETDVSCSPPKKYPIALGDCSTFNSDTMPSLLGCCVPGCKNSKRKVVVGVSYHKFPDDPVERISWFNAIKNVDLNIKNCFEASVCSSHFLPQDIISAKGSRILNPGAVPSVRIPNKSKSVDAISVSSDESSSSSCSPQESRPEPSDSVCDQPVTSDSQNRAMPSLPETISGNDDHSYFYVGGKPIIRRNSCLNYPKESKLPPLLSNNVFTPARTQPYTIGTNSIPAIAVKHNELLYIYPAQLSPINSTSSGPSNIPVKTTANILVAPLSSTTPVGKVFTCSIPSKTAVPANSANSVSNRLEVPEIAGVIANMETANTGGADAPTPNPSTLSKQQFTLDMRNFGSKPSNAKIAPARGNERTAMDLSKFTQTDFKEPWEEMKQRVIDLERKTVQLEYKLAQAKLKRVETTRKLKTAQNGYSRLKKTVTKYKETLDSRKRDIDVLEFKNKQLKLELDKLIPKPPKPQNLKVFVPTNMVGTLLDNFELGQGKPYKDGEIIAFELNPDGQPNNNSEGGPSMITPGQIPTCASKSKYLKKQKLLPSPKIMDILPPSSPPIKKHCLPTTPLIFNESGPLNIETTKTDDGTIVYNLKPAAKKSKSLTKSVPVEMGESEFQTIETLTDEEGDIAYHLLRSPRKMMTDPSRIISQNSGDQLSEDLKAVEVILSLEGDLEECIE